MNKKKLKKKPNQRVNQMAKNRDGTKAFRKGGYKTRKRPKGVSRQGLPKLYPPGHDVTLRAIKVKV